MEREQGRPRQKYPRYHVAPGRFPVRFAGGSISGRGCLRNVSSEGMYLQVDHVPRRHSDVLITIEIPGRDEVQVRARVVWNTALGMPAPTEIPGPAAGFGVVVQTTQASQASWRSFLQEIVLRP
jgi:hypothetical protein